MNLGFLKDLLSSSITAAITLPCDITVNDRNNVTCLGQYAKWKATSAKLKAADEDVTWLFFERGGLEDGDIPSRLVLDLLRKEATLLQRLRHPNMLPVVQPFNENRLLLGLCVKPIRNTLENLMPELSLLDVKSGLLDLCEALDFLHQRANLCHLNINPASIYIDERGKWLLGGLGYAAEIEGCLDMKRCDLVFSGPRTLQDGRSLYVSPPLSYAAPEMTSASSVCGANSDLFSLGLVVWETLISAGQGRWSRIMPSTITRQNHAKEASLLSQRLRQEGRLSSEMKTLVGRFLSANPNERARPTILKNSAHFNDVPLRTLKFVEHLSEKGDLEKAEFMKAFQPMLEKDEHFQYPAILRNRVLPPLYEVLSEQHVGLWPSSIKLVLICTEKINDADVFIRATWPRIRPLLTASKIQVSTVKTLVDHLGTLMRLATETINTDHLIPFALNCLSLPQQDIQQAILEQLPAIIKMFERTPLQHSVLPHVLALISCHQSSATFRSRALSTLKDLTSYFDRKTILDQVLPAIAETIRHDVDTGLLRCIFELYDALRNTLGPELTVIHILPTACPLLTHRALSANDFPTCVSFVTTSISGITEMRRREFAKIQTSHKSVSAILGPAPIEGVSTKEGALLPLEKTTTSLPFDGLFLSEETPTVGSEAEPTLAANVKPCESTTKDLLSFLDCVSPSNPPLLAPSRPAGVDDLVSLLSQDHANQSRPSMGNASALQELAFNPADPFAELIEKRE